MAKLNPHSYIAMYTNHCHTVIFNLFMFQNTIKSLIKAKHKFNKFLIEITLEMILDSITNRLMITFKFIPLQ